MFSVRATHRIVRARFSPVNLAVKRSGGPHESQIQKHMGSVPKPKTAAINPVAPSTGSGDRRYREELQPSAADSFRNLVAAREPLLRFEKDYPRHLLSIPLLPAMVMCFPRMLASPLYLQDWGGLQRTGGDSRGQLTARQLDVLHVVTTEVV